MSDDMISSNPHIARFVGVVSLLAVLILAACQPAPTPPIEGEGTQTRPDLVGLIEWDKLPTNVIFRAMQVNETTSDFLRQGDVAECTIFGDNGMVYLLSENEQGAIVAVDRVSDDAIRSFIEDLTTTYDLFNQTTGITTEEGASLLYETISIAINGQRFSFNSLGGWDGDYYNKVVERCRAVSTTPAEFVPEGGAWISVQPTVYDPNQAAVVWESAPNSFPLEPLANGQRQWVKSGGVVALWDIQRATSPTIQIQQNGKTYQVVIQVPGITFNAPDAP